MGKKVAEIVSEKFDDKLRELLHNNRDVLFGAIYLGGTENFRELTDLINGLTIRYKFKKYGFLLGER
ncbi:hypothetical protein LCGC14_2067060 [marine sediment metagenome]|uniref:Uncharacterized protein n=1 Tax=marine sediment metagenome TaxID=412755 RepID=A0A0F9F6T9_9ZZZZ